MRLIWILLVTVGWATLSFAMEVNKFTALAIDQAPESLEALPPIIYNSTVNLGHGDRFECSPCICSHSFHEYTLANCTFRHLTDVPDSLPLNLWSLNMTGNWMRVFSADSVLRYAKLDTLTIMYNKKLARVSNGTYANITTTMTTLNLTNNRIATIDDGSFRHYGNLLRLHLGNNSLTAVTAAMLEGLHNLKYLNLSKNSIAFIANDSFDELHALEILDLSLNVKLSYTLSKFPPRLFEYLGRLNELYIHGNTRGDESYPNRALQKLSNLQLLSADAATSFRFGPQLHSLKHFYKLYLGLGFGHCRLKNLTRDFFENIPNLREFVIYGCNLMNIDPDAYANLKYLHTLEISHTSETYDLYQAFEHLSGLQNSSLKVLRLIYLYRTKYVCRELHASHAKYLQHIQLEELDLSLNRIALVGDDFCHLLPKTLRRFVLSYNKISSKSFSLFPMMNLVNLVEVIVDNQQDSANDYEEKYFSPVSDFEFSDESNVSSYQCTYMCDSSDQPVQLLTPKRPFKLPPNLRKLQGSNFISFGSKILGHQELINSSLSEIHFSNNYLTDFGHWFLPLPIRKADLSNNYCRWISPTFFVAQSPVVYLNLQNNLLGECFAEDKFGQIFGNVSRLLYLDISMNMIYKLPSRFLVGLNNLETLIVSNNKLQILNLTLGHLTNLKLLDLSRNSIAWITERTRDDLDALAAVTDYELDLTFNPLPCTCSGLPILKWLATTNVKLINQVNLKCYLENGAASSLGNIKHRLELVQRSCIAKSFVLVVSILSFAFVATLLGLLLVYRYRWKLRYLRNIAIAKAIGFKPRSVHHNAFKYDAFFVYDDEDFHFVLDKCIQELEVKRGHTLCMADRDFMPGTYAISDILSAVQNSYKTIPLFTPEFYDSEYSEYAVKMAVMEEIHKSRQVMHVCLYKTVDLEEMSLDFIAAMKGNNYTEYPPEEDITPELVEQFWNQLSAAIKQAD